MFEAHSKNSADDLGHVACKTKPSKTKNSKPLAPLVTFQQSISKQP